MLRVTIDIFSGRPNPSWVVSDDESVSILREIALHCSVAGNPSRDSIRLGFRRMILEPLQDQAPAESSLPHAFSIADGTSANEAKAIEIAQKLIDKAPFENPAVGAIWGEADRGAAQRARAFFAGQIVKIRSPSVTTSLEWDEIPPQTMLPALSAYETAPFAPEFWNAPAHVARNNCYAYASNRRTDSFPQPGRSSGRGAASLSAGEIAEGAMSDGAVSAMDDVDSSEAPRYLAALFVWPDRDYHWYRLHSDNSWGHKPGPWPARMLDDTGMSIRDPRVCSRGDYSDFCGFFLFPKNCTVK
jgi:hypothetical protein